MLFEFIEIIDIDLIFNIDLFFQNLFKPDIYQNYEILLEKPFINQNEINVSKKDKGQNDVCLFNFVMKEKKESREFKFLTYYNPYLNFFCINIEIYNREKSILLNFLNTRFKNKFYFKTFSPHRDRIWDFLKKENTIDLEIFEEGRILSYEDFYENENIIKNIENYLFFSSLVSFKINDETIIITLYGYRIDLPNDFDIFKFNLLFEKIKFFLEK